MRVFVHGVPETPALWSTPEMARCILSLYRSAAQPAMRELGERQASAARRPGLIVIPTEDPYAGTPEMATEVARTLGAAFLRLEGLGHWWMFEGAGSVADALVAHWGFEGSSLHSEQSSS